MARPPARMAAALLLGSLALLLSTAHAAERKDPGLPGVNGTDRNFGELGCGGGCDCPFELDCVKQAGCCWRDNGSLRTGPGFGVCETGDADKKGKCIIIRQKSPSPPRPPPSPPSPSPPYPPTFAPTYPPTFNCALLGEPCNEKSLPCCSFEQFCSLKSGTCVNIKQECAKFGEVCNSISNPCCDGKECSNVLGRCL